MSHKRHTLHLRGCLLSSLKGIKGTHMVGGVGAPIDVTQAKLSSFGSNGEFSPCFLFHEFSKKRYPIKSLPYRLWV